MATLPPTLPGLPFLGPALAFSKDWQAYTQRVAAVGDVVRVRFPFATLTYVMHPDGVEHVLHHNQKNYWKGRQMARGKVFFGDGLVLSEGDLWRRQRLRMAPVFRPGRVAALAPVMAARIAACLDAWGDGGPRDVHQDMMSLTLQVALEALFHQSGAAYVTRVGAAFQVISDHVTRPAQLLGDLPLWVPTPANRRVQRALAELQSVIDAILAARRAQGDPGEDLLGLLLQGLDDEGSPMDDRLLYDELRTLLLASHETTSVGLTTTLWLLAGHPEVQEALAAEAAEVSGGQPVQAEHGPRLILAERAFKEAMRLYPPVPILWRESYADDEIGGYRVPAGSTVLLGPWYTHRDARWFPDPLRFDLDRWTPEAVEARPRWAYFPFGGGARVCIGMGMALTEARLALGELLRRFSFERAEPGELALIPSMTLRPSAPVRLRVQPRAA